MSVTSTPTGISIGGKEATKKRITNAALIGVPLLGSLYAIHYFSRHDISVYAILQLVAWYLFTGICLGIGFHRLFSHKSFETSATVRFILGLGGSMAFQGSVVRWIADHRRHHRFADGPEDTHTPHRFAKTNAFTSPVRNLWFAHVGWMFDSTTTDSNQYASDLLRDPIARWLHRWYPATLMLSLFLPFAVGYVIGGTEEAIQGILLGGFVRITLLHQFVWAINSIGHYWGDRPSTQLNQARNNAALSILLLGEGWHNNHHAAPRCAHLNWRGDEIDPNGAIIDLLERLGIVWNVYRVRLAGVTPKPPSN